MCASVVVGVAVAITDDVCARDDEGELAGLLESWGVGEPVQELEEALGSSPARLGLAGRTSSVPIATVPVATAPTNDAADRLLRACFGTAQTPSFRHFRAIRFMRRTGRTVPP